jgi:hypothetical protein
VARGTLVQERKEQRVVTKKHLFWSCMLMLAIGLEGGYVIGTLVWRVWRWQ